MHNLANSADPDEMLHNNAAFLLAERKKYNFYLEVITCDPSIHTMEHPKLNPLVHKGLNREVMRKFLLQKRWCILSLSPSFPFKNTILSDLFMIQ